jgi:hypothetical protein
MVSVERRRTAASSFMLPPRRVAVGGALGSIFSLAADPEHLTRGSGLPAICAMPVRFGFLTGL